jgi:hypothetical protein
MTVEINQLALDVWEHRVFTTARPTGVFDYIADFEKHVEWERELVAVKPLNRRTGTAGARTSRPTVPDRPGFPAGCSPTGCGSPAS